MSAAIAMEDPQPAEVDGVDDDGGAWTRGQVGTLLLILAETSFFCVFIVAYLFYIGKSASGPQPADVLELPILASVCLLSSSATIVISVRGLARGQLGPCIAGLAATIGLGGTFLYLTALEWYDLIFDHGLVISTNLFGTTFYSLVGFHAAHVAIGLMLMTLVLSLAVLGHVRAEHSERLELLSWYWHFVDAVWIAVFTVVYVAGM
jgi:cytochrome c oxidase subunit 3/cytochrome o ubiquinol oxidase subunit 3